MLARASVVNQFYFANVTLNGTNTVTAASCSVTSVTSVTSVDEPVQLGDHNRQEFSGVGYTTEWKAFNIVLDCNKSAHIYVQIDATKDASNAPGVMAIDSESGGTAATGVGVQLYFAPDNSAAQFGQVKDYYTSPNGGMETVQLKARYYQAASAVTAGPANETATFTLTYK